MSGRSRDFPRRGASPTTAIETPTGIFLDVDMKQSNGQRRSITTPYPTHRDLHSFAFFVDNDNILGKWMVHKLS
jgi:hypothetical protein